MDRIFRYGSRQYKYDLERLDRKTFSLIVLPNLKIKLKAPIRATDEDIELFLKKKWIWLNKQINELKRYKKITHEREFVSGESVYYLGRQHMLKIERGKNEGIKVIPGAIILTTSKQIRDTNHNRSIYKKWYTEKCELVFKKELCAALKEYDIHIIPKLRIREMKSRWGSYQKGNIINLNPKLLQASKTMIHYVITHELCHIEHKNHDSDFFFLLESRIPDWRKIKDELELKFG